MVETDIKLYSYEYLGLHDFFDRIRIKVCRLQHVLYSMQARSKSSEFRTTKFIPFYEGHSNNSRMLSRRACRNGAERRDARFDKPLFPAPRFYYRLTESFSTGNVADSMKRSAKGVRFLSHFGRILPINV